MPKLLISLLAYAIVLPGQTPGPTFPITGKEVTSLLPYENAVRGVMQKWSIPGASVAIADGSRLIYARGLGYADREAGEPVRPTSRFRLASISKTMTGMTILKLVEEGKINLDTPFMNYLPDLKPTTTPPPDPRMAKTTVRQLMQHTGGFDLDDDVEYVNYYGTASRLFNQPVSVDLMTRYIISQSLQFDPGARYAYSNCGYQLLGRVIEKVAGKKYLEVIYDKLLRPAGATSVEVGGNLLSQRLADEVKYYDYPGAPLSTTLVAPGAVMPTPRPYNRRVDLADSYGGLIGHAADMLKYLTALEGRRGPALLSAASRAAMIVRPPTPVWPATGNYVGLTWRIVPITGGEHWWHSGGASGTRNLLARRQNGKSWVVLMNSRPQNEDQIIDDLFAAMAAAEAQVKDWPTNDLFPDFAGPVLAASAEVLSFAHWVGSAPPEPQKLQVTASGSGANLVVDPPSERWLKVDKLAGPTPVTLSVSVDPAGLTPGDYQTQLSMTAPNAANGPRLVRVTLRVSPAPQFTSIRSSASQAPVTGAAPESRLTLEADEIAAAAETAPAVPEPGRFAGVTVRVTDGGGEERLAAIVGVTPKRVDLIVPAGVPPGEVTIGVITHKGRLVADRIQVTSASPALFSANGDGKGAALATFVRTAEDGAASDPQPAYQCGEERGSCTPVEIALGAETDKVDLQLAATGIRGVTDPAAYAVKIGDESAEVLAIEPSKSAGGVDLVTVRLPRAAAGRGELDLVLTVAEIASNAVKVNVK